MRQPAPIHQLAEVLVVGDKRPLLVVGEREQILIAGSRRNLRGQAYIVAQTDQHPAQPDRTGTLVEQESQWF